MQRFANAPMRPVLPHESGFSIVLQRTPVVSHLSPSPATARPLLPHESPLVKGAVQRFAAVKPVVQRMKHPPEKPPEKKPPEDPGWVKRLRRSCLRNMKKKAKPSRSRDFYSVQVLTNNGYTHMDIEYGELKGRFWKGPFPGPFLQGGITYDQIVFAIENRGQTNSIWPL